jgi:hypothetical protein
MGIFTAAMSASDHHFLREDRKVLWQRIARHIEMYPKDLRIALENLDRWEAVGRVHPGPLREWRVRILAAQRSEVALQELVAFLAAPNHDSEPLKSCSPFVGLPIAAQASPHPA